MKPSDIYLNEIFIWKVTQRQLDLMLNDTCPYDFEITKPNNF